MILNTLAIKQALGEGGVVLGTWVFEFDTPGIARLLASTGIDFVVYDMEHSGFGIETIRNLVGQSRALDLAALVRTAAGETHLIGPVLDVGAGGIIVPRVETASEAAKVVESCRYYPEGRRGAAFSIAHDDFLPGDVANKTKAANDSMLCGLLIETALGVENIDAILAVPGVDLIWVGHLDLSLSMGIPGQFTNPRFKEALSRILQACESNGSNGMPAGILANDASQTLEYVRQGFRCISYSGDVWLLQRALSEGVQAIRMALSRRPNHES
ncbi:MAG: hypothetical protein DMG27_05610 [Acidobacteria bacterium]|nr:MAG: hypothetical protein DMG27_05610 [Acidobacteriota bacterium]